MSVPVGVGRVEVGYPRRGRVCLERGRACPGARASQRGRVSQG